jgi:predicted histidine transporter YuiF (NhaC family)
MDIWYAILVAVGAVLIAVLLLSVGVIFRKDKQFRSQHISENKRMREKGIHCVVSQDREAKKVERGKLKVENL